MFSDKFELGLMDVQDPNIPSTDSINPNRMDQKMQLRMHDQAIEESQTLDMMPEGVEKIEAITIAWSKRSLIVAYVGIFLVYFWTGLVQFMSSSLLPYVTSNFAEHSLVSTTTMVCFIIGGVVQLPLAKLIDLWGRLEGLLLMLVFYELGLILISTCNTIEAYIAGMVIYEIGFSGILYVLTVLIADTSRMKNRPLTLAISNAPGIITTFAASPLAETFLYHSTWRWAYGMCSIVMAAVSLPIVLVLWTSQRKSRQLSISQAQQSQRTAYQSCLHYCIEFDVIGVILFGAGVTIFLLPFTLASSATKSWKSATVITMIVLGFSFILAFVIYEWFFCSKSFLPFHLLNDRTILGACIFNASFTMSYFIWETYYSSYLQVVHGQSIKYAGYIINIYWNGLGLASILTGLFVQYSSTFKKLAVFGVSLMAIGCGLLIHFRQPETDIGYLVMCQIFIGVGGGILSIAQYLALLVRSTCDGHVSSPKIAILLSLSYLSQKIGGAIGLCISGGIWTNLFVDALKRRLPDQFKGQAELIYSSIYAQLAAPVGSVTRNAIDLAYSDIQRKLTITATTILALSFLGVVIWRNFKLVD